MTKIRSSLEEPDCAGEKVSARGFLDNLMSGKEPDPKPASKPGPAPSLPEETHEFVAGKPFALSSSYGPSSQIVKKMAEVSEKNGENIPLYIYEIMQGQFDHGRNADPPPRTWIERKSGKREMLNGNGIEQISDDPIMAIEFANGGNGMTPEDAVIDRHGGGEDTLGMHGHGTTVSLCYLAQLDMPVSIRSHYRGNTWSGRTSLKTTESGVAKILHLDGKWEKEDNEPKNTVFRVENPTEKMIKDLARAGQYFIYANPKYPGAVLVPKDENADSKIPNAVAIRSGQVQCVEGIVPQAYDKEGRCDTVFVDGLAMKNVSHRSSIFPWAIQGLGNSDHYKFFVKRKYDSSGIEGSPDHVVALAFRQLENKELLKRALAKSIGSWCNYWEFSIENEGESKALPANVAALVRQIWEEDYENAAIDSSDERIRWYKNIAKDAKARCVSKGVYFFLKAAGVQTIEDQSGIKNAQKMGNLRELYMPSVFESNGFERFMEMLGKEGAGVDMVTLSGKRHIRIQLPQVIKNYEQLNGEDEGRGGVLLRMAAALAKFKRLSLRAFSLEPECINEMDIQTVIYADKKVATEVTFLERARKSIPEFLTWENGRTYMLFPGEHLEPPSEELLKSFRKALERFGKMRGKFRGFKPSRDEADDDSRSDGDNGGGYGGLANMAKTILRSGVGQIPIDRGFSIGKKNPSQIEKKESILPNGYYANGVGTTFMFNSGRGRAEWEGAENWAAEDVSRVAPQLFTSKVVMNNLDGEMRLNVLAGQKIVALETDANANVELFREVRTGHYLAKGQASNFCFYTVSDDDDFYSLMPPIPDEQEDVLDSSLLLPHWREFIGSVRNNPALTTFSKVQLAQRAWAEKFTYSDDDGLDDQSIGKSREEVAAKVVNTSRGICNIGATGLALLLRAVGVPSRVISGYLKQGEDEGGSHMWVEYWNNKRWIPLEAEMGASFAPSVKKDGKFSDVASLQEALEMLNGSRKPAELSEPISFIPRNIKSVRALVGAALVSVVALGAAGIKAHNDEALAPTTAFTTSSYTTPSFSSNVNRQRDSIRKIIKEHCDCLIAPQRDPLCATQTPPKKSKRK